MYLKMRSARFGCPFPNPLSMARIVSLLEIPIDQVDVDISPFHLVIYIPSRNDGHVAIFHVREFIVGLARPP